MSMFVYTVKMTLSVLAVAFAHLDKNWQKTKEKKTRVVLLVPIVY